LEGGRRPEEGMRGGREVTLAEFHASEEK